MTSRMGRHTEQGHGLLEWFNSHLIPFLRYFYNISTTDRIVELIDIACTSIARAGKFEEDDMEVILFEIQYRHSPGGEVVPNSILSADQLSNVEDVALFLVGHRIKNGNLELRMLCNNEYLPIFPIYILPMLTIMLQRRRISYRPDSSIEDFRIDRMTAPASLLNLTRPTRPSLMPRPEDGRVDSAVQG